MIFLRNVHTYLVKDEPISQVASAENVLEALPHVVVVLVIDLDKDQDKPEEACILNSSG